jgi:hypothetical protein
VRSLSFMWSRVRGVRRPGVDHADGVLCCANVPRSEIKEEPKAGDIRGGGYPVPSARTPNTAFSNNNAEGEQA